MEWDGEGKFALGRLGWRDDIILLSVQSGVGLIIQAGESSSGMQNNRTESVSESF